jgi:hypothetical protein
MSFTYAVQCDRCQTDITREQTYDRVRLLVMTEHREAVLNMGPVDLSTLAVPVPLHFCSTACLRDYVAEKW